MAWRPRFQAATSSTLDGVRLLWEIIHSPEGARRGEYERIWADQCAFPAGLFDMSLGSVPEPTSSKWQVMYGVAEKLQPILEPVAHGQWKHADATSRPSYLEVFLDACRQLMCGSTDQERTGTVSHLHKEKIQTLNWHFQEAGCRGWPLSLSGRWQCQLQKLLQVCQVTLQV